MLSFLRQLFGRGRSERYFIAIDVGSNTAIRSLLFSEAAHDRISLQKQHFELPRRDTYADLVPLVDAHLRRILSQYVKGIRAVPTGIVIGLGSSFAVNDIRTVRRERPKPENAVEPEEIRGILDGFIATETERTINGEQHALAHLMPFRVTLDGYPIHAVSPTTAGRILEVQIFATYVPSALWARLAGLRALWGGMPIRFISDQAAIAAVVITLMNVPDAALIKIGARVTEVTLLADGGIPLTGRFARGGDDVTRAIAARLRMSDADAERIKRQLGATELPRDTLAAVTGIVTGEVEIWLANLVQFFKDNQRMILPDRVYLYGGGAGLALLRQRLAAKAWYHDLTFRDELGVMPLTAEDIPGLRFRNAVSPVRGPEEVALAALIHRADH